MKFEKVEKILLADIKTDVKQEIKKLVAASYSFSQKYLLITCGWHSMQPDIFHEEWGKWWGGGGGGVFEGVFN